MQQPFLIKSKNMTKSLSFLIVLCIISIHSFAQAKKIIVAKDGSGNYTTVQAALDAVKPGNTKPVSIFIKKGL